MGTLRCWEPFKEMTWRLINETRWSCQCQAMLLQLLLCAWYQLYVSLLSPVWHLCWSTFNAPWGQLINHHRGSWCSQNIGVRDYTWDIISISWKLTRQDGMAKWVERTSPVLGDCWIQTYAYERCTRQTTDIACCACLFLARDSVLLGLDIDWLA